MSIGYKKPKFKGKNLIGTILNTVVIKWKYVLSFLSTFNDENNAAERKEPWAGALFAFLTLRMRLLSLLRS